MQLCSTYVRVPCTTTGACLAVVRRQFHLQLRPTAEAASHGSHPPIKNHKKRDAAPLLLLRCPCTPTHARDTSHTPTAPLISSAVPPKSPAKGPLRHAIFQKRNTCTEKENTQIDTHNRTHAHTYWFGGENITAVKLLE